ncbi:MAG: sulfotransferase [Anaerolineae bacterium]|nr:sulfotransferase [Anaerolineae bacterium]
MKRGQGIFGLISWVYLGRLHNWVQVLKTQRVEARYLGRLMWLLSTSFLTLPLRIYEHTRYQRQLAQVEIKQAPVFILGHPRSGTTYLHHLLCKDAQWGYLSTFHAIAPGFFLIGNKMLKPLMAKCLPDTRLIDKVSIQMDAPQEEEIALYGLSPHAIVYRMHFPCNAREYFTRYALLRNLSAEILNEWQSVYLDLLRKVTFANAGKRLLLKSPGHTGRIPTLLKLFPDAKFIHICRNPYDVFLSTCHLYRMMLARGQLHSINESQIEADVLFFYKVLMQKFIADRHLIPPENLIEVRFEDLEADAFEVIHHIYTHLNLPNWEAAVPAFQDYLDGKKGYTKNTYPLTQDTLVKVNEAWGFAFEAWGYMRQPGATII